MDQSNLAGRNRRVVCQAIEGLEERRLFATFTVTTAADSGAGSLREALTLANADTARDTVRFSVPGSGVHRISPVNPLPPITSPVDIDCYSQPGSSANTLAVGDNALPLIELNGDAVNSTTAAGLYFTPYFSGTDYLSPNGSSVRGLIVNGAFQDKIYVNGAGIVNGVTIAGNFLGVTADGTAAAPSPGVPFNNGVHLGGGSARSSQIGGPAAADRNVIAGTAIGVYLADASSNNVIENNYIGLDATGTQALPQGAGIEIVGGGQENVIGGVTAAQRNVIGGSDGVSIFGANTAKNRVIGNYIGTAADGVTKPAGSALNEGVLIASEAGRNFVGGTTSAEGNVIAYAIVDGVGLGSNSVDNSIRLNSIFANGQAIDLIANGSASGSINDFGDGDEGANHVQNFAVITSAVATAAGTRVETVFNSRAARIYVADFYASDAGDPANGQAKKYLGSASVVTDPYGNASVTANLPAVPAGTLVTNTVTDVTNAPYGNTSQASPAVAVQGNVPPPPPATLPAFSVADVSVNEGNSGTKTLTFTVKLSKAATSVVSVLYATQDGTAKTSDNDYVAKSGTLAFAAGETSKTISVTIKGDTKVEGNESFKLLLSGASGATIADGSAVGTIKNDDAAPTPPKLSVGGYTTTEGHGGTKAFTFKVTLDKSSAGPITVKYATLGDTAKAGGDYTAVSGTLTFAAGETSKMVTVYVKGDKTKEGDEKFYLVLSSPTNAAIAVAKGTGLIRNDD